MLKRRLDLIFELFPVDGATSSPSASRVAGLDHEIGDDTMEDHIIEVATLGKGGEVLAGFRGMVIVEFDRDGTLKSSLSKAED